MRHDQLHVITPISNPTCVEARMRCFEPFMRHMVDSGVKLHVPEIAYGDIPHQVDPIPGVHHIKLFAKSHIWTKENAINIAISRLPCDWKYVAWIDSDIHFRNRHWARDTLRALQHFDVVQPWTTCYDLGPNDEHLQHHTSFCKVFHDTPHHIGKSGPYTFAHPGYAWAATRSAIEKVGGLLDIGVLGAGDHHMALALAGKGHGAPNDIHPAYKRHVERWGKRARRHIAGNIGYVPGTIEHSWHGRKADRKYVSRWDILRRHDFDPDQDLKRNIWGVYELTSEKPALKRDIWHYFRQRNEDANSID